MPNKTNNFWLPYGVLFALILIQFLPFALGTKWLWGVGYLTLVPPLYLIGYWLVIGISLLVPFLPQAEKWGDSFGKWFGRTFFESKSKYLNRALFLLITGAAFVMFLMPTHFLGDGYTFLSNVGSSSGNWVKWSEGGAVLVVMGIRSLIGAPNEDTALRAYQIVSVAGGLVAIWFYFLIVRTLSKEPVKQLLVFVILLFSSSLLLFFGYVESYPILWGPLAGFLYFSLGYANEGTGIAGALICLAIASALHLQAVMYFPALGFLLLSRGAGLVLYQKLRTVVWGIAGLAIIAVGYLFFRKINSDLAFQNIFLYPFSGKPAYPGYSIFSLRHLADLLNLFLLVYPFGLVILTLGRGNGRNIMSNRTTAYLGLLSIGSLLFLLLVDPSLSMPRDWDLFASCWIAPILLLLHLVKEPVLRSLKRLVVSVAVISSLTVCSFLVVNLDKERSVAEIKQIVTDNQEKSFGTLSILRMYYEKAGDRPSADSIEALRESRYPDFFALKAAFSALRAGELDYAEKTLRGVRPDPYSKDFHQVSAEFFMRKQNYDSALYHAEAAVQLQPYYERGYTTMSSAYFLRHETDKAIASLHRGLSLNNESVPLNVGLAATFVSAGKFDSAVAYGTRALSLDSTAAQAYYYLAQAYDSLGNREKALACARKYVGLGEESPEYTGYQQKLLQQFPELDSTKTKGSDSTQTSQP